MQTFKVATSLLVLFSTVLSGSLIAIVVNLEHRVYNLQQIVQNQEHSGNRFSRQSSDSFTVILRGLVREELQTFLACNSNDNSVPCTLQPGPKGEKGNIGEQGKDGQKGERGFVGSRGDRGPIGSQGPVGYRGPKGDRGTIGPRGDRGFVGPQGSVGDRGPKGDTGDIGAKGNVGGVGPKGEPGIHGPMGLKGKTGLKGTKGEQGYPGFKGEKGERGERVETPVPVTTTSQLVGTLTEEPPTVSETCGGPGWRRVAFINMSDPNQQCPQGLTDRRRSSIRTCGKRHTERFECSSVTFPGSTDGSEYSKVCGRAVAYRYGPNYAFRGYHDYNQNIHGWYVDGLSLTHGPQHSHIWTFASGWYNEATGDLAPGYHCPCDVNSAYNSTPPFVGNNYFCDSVATYSTRWNIQFYPNNALWDGQSSLKKCYNNNNPPWFKKTLPNPTTDDIELRMCLFNGGADIGIVHLELYVN